MSAIVSAILGPILQAILGVITRYADLAWLRGDAARDERLRQANAALTATAEEQAKIAAGVAALEVERAKDPERLSKDWFAKGAGIVVLAIALTGCTTVVRTPLTVQPTLIGTPRPAFPEITDPQRTWLVELIKAYEANCVTLSIIGGTSPTDAAARCRIR